MDSRHKEQGWVCVKTKFVVISGHKPNSKPILVWYIQQQWNLLPTYVGLFYGYVFDGSPEKKHWWWTQLLWKGNLGLLCSVLLLKVQEEGAQRVRGWKNEIYLFIFGGWKNLYFLNIIVKQILRLMIKNSVFWVSLV